MARFSIYPILVAFFLATAISATKEESVEECAKHVGSYCGKQVFDKLFLKGKNISLDCCYKLVQMGHSCDTKLVKLVLESDPDLKNASGSKVLAKSDRIYYKCDQVTKPKDPQVVGMCRQKIGVHCEKEVLYELVHHKSNMTKHCCEKLVKTGKNYHVDLVKDWLRTSTNPEIRSANATQVLERSKEMFYYCEHGSGQILP